MTTTKNTVALSRAAGRLTFFLNIEGQTEFRNAVEHSESISKLPNPFRSWLKDPNNIPDEKRRTVWIGKDLTDAGF